MLRKRRVVELTWRSSVSFLSSGFINLYPKMYCPKPQDPPFRIDHTQRPIPLDVNPSANPLFFRFADIGIILLHRMMMVDWLPSAAVTDFALEIIPNMFRWSNQISADMLVLGRWPLLTMVAVVAPAGLQRKIPQDSESPSNNYSCDSIDFSI